MPDTAAFGNQSFIFPEDMPFVRFRGAVVHFRTMQMPPVSGEGLGCYTAALQCFPKNGKNHNAPSLLHNS
jgi:hypothetical protein